MLCNETLVANFVQKTFDILENEKFSHIIAWLPLGKSFIIKDSELFESVILPNVFRHNNINSFIRQLNMYDFHKSRKEPTKNIFSHPNFLMARQDLLSSVKRKIKNQETLRSDPTAFLKIQQTIEKQNQGWKSQKSILQVPCEKAEEKTAVKENNIFSQYFLPNTSFVDQIPSCFNIEISPLKSLISKSYIMDSNPDIYTKMHDPPSMAYIGSEDFLFFGDYNPLQKIEEDFDKEWKFFQNRTNGICLMETKNYINEMKF